MLFRFSLLLNIVFVAITSFAQIGFAPAPKDFGYRASLTGTVRDATGLCLPDVRIEIQDAMTGRFVTTVYSSTNGSFQAYDLPRGQYEVIVSMGIIESRARIDLDMPREVDFRLAVNQPDGNDGRGQSVSLSQMKVPGKARKLFQKAMAAFRLAHLDDAFNLVQKALGSCPDYAQALTLRGLLSMQKGDNKSAQPDLEKAVELDYADDMSFVALASLYNTEGNYDQALKVLDRGMSVHPTSWQALMETARAQNGKKQYQDALKALAKLEKYAPANLTYRYLYRAQAFVGLKNYPAAVTELEAFLSKEKSGPNVEPAEKTLEQLRGAVIQEAKK